MLQEGEYHARLGPKLCRLTCKLCNWKKHSLITIMDREMPPRTHRPTHASMEQTLNEEEEINLVSNQESPVLTNFYP